MRIFPRGDVSLVVFKHEIVEVDGKKNITVSPYRWE